MSHCAYCKKDIDSIEKVLIRMITPEYHFIDRWYHVKCYCDSMDDKKHLAEISAMICMGIL